MKRIKINKESFFPIWNKDNGSLQIEIRKTTDPTWKQTLLFTNECVKANENCGYYNLSVADDFDLMQLRENCIKSMVAEGIARKTNQQKYFLYTTHSEYEFDLSKMNSAEEYNTWVMNYIHIKTKQEIKHDKYLDEKFERERRIYETKMIERQNSINKMFNTTKSFAIYYDNDEEYPEDRYSHFTNIIFFDEQSAIDFIEHQKISHNILDEDIYGGHYFYEEIDLKLQK